MTLLSELKKRVPIEVIRSRFRQLKQEWRKTNKSIPYRQYRDRLIETFGFRRKKITAEEMVRKIWNKIDDDSMTFEQFRDGMLPQMQTSTLGQQAQDIVLDRELERAMAFGAAYRASKNGS